MNVYIGLTTEFNRNRLRAILSSGQAVVLHHLAIMSKDGDWILREDTESLDHIRKVLEGKGARYRFGAPLDLRWMRGGWSSHFEFRHGELRVRTDFVTRPPRITPERLAAMWTEQEGRALAFVDLVDLIELKKTNREKDYAVIGEMARMLDGIGDRLRYSRSAREIVALVEAHPDMSRKLSHERPILSAVAQGIEAVEQALDAERRMLIHANEDRLRTYLDASAKWAECWKRIEPDMAGLPLADAHRLMVQRAQDALPFEPGGRR